MSNVGSDVADRSEALPNAATRALYDRDEFGWMLQQADLLRAGRLDEIDRHSLAEYLADMARSKQAAFRSAMIVLLQHMLKATVQPEKVARSWLLTIIVQRREIGFLIEDEPGVRQCMPGLYAQAYPAAREAAAIETGIEISRFPLDSPWTMDEVLTASLPEPAPSTRLVPAQPPRPARRSGNGRQARPPAVPCSTAGAAPAFFPESAPHPAPPMLTSPP